MLIALLRKYAWIETPAGVPSIVPGPGGLAAPTDPSSNKIGGTEFQFSSFLCGGAAQILRARGN
jgi:hypothetical protein